MKFGSLIAGFDALTVHQGGSGAVLSDITDDSRAVTPGACFVARDTGDDRWRGYVATAIRQGAAAVIAPSAQGLDLPAMVACATGPNLDQPLAGALAARFFGGPSNKLKLIGITGTNGKTTIAMLTQYLLQQAGTKCGLMGTIVIDHGSPAGPQTAELTTPGAIEVQRHLAQMVEHGCEACAMEVSSHALDQGRVAGLSFAAAVFTNLTQDHLDYHGTMEAYAAAKAKLFGMLGEKATAVVNADDPAGVVMAQASSAPVWATTLDPDQPVMGWASQTCVGAAKALAASYSVVSLDGPWGAVAAKLPMVGRHNLSNVLQALAAASAVTPMGDALTPVLQHCPVVPGRLEPVTIEGVETPAVLVDYAHTPDALVNVVSAMRPLTPGRLIVVFGCGGDRDRTKRPKMAAAACGLADAAVLTSDNPRTEDPRRILDDAWAGVPEDKQAIVTVEIDRAKAIRAAILGAAVGDTVLIAGKGHEDYQIIADPDSPTGTRKTHFDDREHAAEALAAWREQHA